LQDQDLKLAVMRFFNQIVAQNR